MNGQLYQRQQIIPFTPKGGRFYEALSRFMLCKPRLSQIKDLPSPWTNQKLQVIVFLKSAAVGFKNYVTGVGAFVQIPLELISVKNIQILIFLLRKNIPI